MQFGRTVARNSAWGMGAQIAIKILSFAFSVLVLRHLGTSEYGQYAGALAFGAMFVFIADLGLSQYIVREIAGFRSDVDGRQKSELLYGNTLILRLLLSVVAVLVMLAAAVLTARPPLMVGAIALGGLGLIMYAVQGTSDAVLGAFERFDLSASARVVNQAVFLVLGGLALWLGFGYYGLIIANLLGIASVTFVCWSAVRRIGIRPRDIQMARWPALIRASLPFGIITFTLGLSYKFDSVLLNVTRSDAETGYYNAAYNLVFSAAIISNVFNTALFPSLARRAKETAEPLTNVYGRSLRYLMMIGLPIAVVLSVLADKILPLLYTDAYFPAVEALRVVIWAVPLMFLSELLGYVAVVQNRERAVARSIFISTSINIGMNLILVPRFGFVAAAAMTLVTEAVLAGQYLWLLRATLRQVNWQRALILPIAATLVTGVLLLITRNWPLIAQVALGAVAYCFLLVGLGILGRDDLALVSHFRRARADDSVGSASLPKPDHTVVPTHAG